MNLLLLHPRDRLDENLYRVSDRRADHVRRVLGRTAGDELRAGLLNGPPGRARILEDDARGLRLAFREEGEPPPPLALSLVLALPRPPMLHRVLHDATTLGIKRIVLVNSRRVEKSFWQSHRLSPESLTETLVQGLEQAGDTMVPQVLLRQRFRPFVEDELEAFSAASRRILAHPGDHPPLPADLDEPVTLAVGPEGGWIDFEVGALQRAGFQCHHLGSRILRVETAVPTLVGRLMRLA